MIGAGKQEARPRDTYAGQHDPVRWLAGWLAGRSRRWRVNSNSSQFAAAADGTKNARERAAGLVL